MREILARKFRQLWDDPVLRDWLIGHVFGRWPGEPPFTHHRPPYLEGLLPLPPETPTANFPECGAGPPGGPLDVRLPGVAMRLQPGEEARLFERIHGDVEVELAVHRFAWLDEDTDPAWMVAIWRAWADRFGNRMEGWPWHPYTAAERGIALLRFADRHGLPGPDALPLLVAHGPTIAARLEFFGDHHTSNHLFNNGRGLYLLGLGLGLPLCADLGARILVEEAQRIFRPSGVLREGSSHYHALLAARLQEVAAAARAHGRPEAEPLEAKARKALAVLPRLRLPGGIPLVGDISPDIAPARLFPALAATEAVATEFLALDGWLRADFGSWAGLWHAAPDGWLPMPGHGHQDLGGFELHHGDEPIFIDPGRGSYGEAGEAAHYRSAKVHNTLLVDGHDPYPPNRPYYDETFRRRIGGPPPELKRDGEGVALRHCGYGRLGSVGPVMRRWRFHDKGFRLIDTITGSGRRQISRRLVTPLAVERSGETILLKGDRATLRLSGPEIRWETLTITRWTAYGEGHPATLVAAETTASLPWTGEIIVEIL